MIVGTAGITGGGVLDPLPALADLANQWHLHFHVDAAWAGAIALSDLLRPTLGGIERADTVTVDAHKRLSVPMGAGMIFSADPTPVTEAFHMTTGYMPAAEWGHDPYTSSMQWSRRAIGLKVFLSLATSGREGYARQIERDVALGTYIAERAEADGWKRINTTPLPVACLADPAADARDAGFSYSRHCSIA